MKNSIQKFSKCIVLASAALSLTACVLEPVPYGGPAYGGGPYGYAEYPPYYGYGYNYGPNFDVGFYNGGHHGHSWHHWR